MTNAIILQGQPVMILARVFNADGTPVTADDVFSLTADVYDRDTGLRTGGPYTNQLARDCFFDSFQTGDPRWTVDRIGFNFAMQIETAAFQSGRNFQVQITVTPTPDPVTLSPRQPFRIVARLTAETVYQ